MYDKNKYLEKFPFIDAFTFLIASINPEKKTQSLIFEKFNPETDTRFSDTLNCIITVYTEYFEDEQNDLDDTEDERFDFKNNVLNNLDEGFFAFKSWVQGIAEAGIEAIRIQTEIEENEGSRLPIVQFLFKNIMRTNSSIITSYLEKIEQECRFEGTYHKPSLRANLGVILNAITPNLSNPPYPNTFDLKRLLEYIETIAKMDSEFLFSYSKEHMELRHFLAKGPSFVKYPEYLSLFSPEELVKYGHDIAENPMAVDLPEFEKLFSLNITIIKYNLANNSFAVKFPEYSNFFSDADKLIRETAADNPEAVKLPEYSKLLQDQDNEIAYIALDHLVLVKLDSIESDIIRKIHDLSGYGSLIKISIETENNHITSLKISGKNLSEYVPSLIDLKYLKSLTIHEGFSKINKSLKNMKSLIYLDLRGFNSSNIPETIEELESLKELHLEDNHLESLPTNISKLESLEVLVLTKNRLTTLPEDLEYLKSLRKLHLEDNHLESLPPSISNLENLQILDLSENQLSFLPNNFGFLKSLTSLNLDRNKITRLPENICSLEKLQELKLSHNKLTELSPTFGNLILLQKLDLYGNMLTYLPEAIGNLQSIQIMVLSENPLKSLPISMKELKNLKELYLFNTNLEGNLLINFPFLRSTAKQYYPPIDKKRKNEIQIPLLKGDLMNDEKKINHEKNAIALLLSSFCILTILLLYIFYSISSRLDVILDIFMISVEILILFVIIRILFIFKNWYTLARAYLINLTFMYNFIFVVGDIGMIIGAAISLGVEVTFTIIIIFLIFEQVWIGLYWRFIVHRGSYLKHFFKKLEQLHSPE